MGLRWRWALWTLIVVVCAAGLRHYRVDNGIDDWMPDLAAHDAGSFLIIGGFRGAADADEVAEHLSQDPAISACLSPGVLQRLDLDPIDLVLSKDGLYAGVICFATPRLGEAAFLSAVKHRLRDRWTELAVAGPAVFRQAVNHTSQQRLDLIMALIAVVGTLLTWATVGSLRLALLVVAALLSAQVALLGAISWLGQPIDMTLSMVPPLMTALGFSYAAHHLLRHGAGPSLLLCGVTTLLGIGSFAFTPVPPVRHFAVAGMAGLLVTWLAVVLLTPAAGAQRRANPTVDCAWQWLTERVVDVIRRNTAWIIVTALVAIAMSAVAARLVRLETNPLRYFPREAKIVHDYDQLNKRLTGMLPSVVEVRGDVDAAQMLRSSGSVRYVLNLGLLQPAATGTYLVMADQNALSEIAAAQSTWQHWAGENDLSMRWTGVAAQLQAVGQRVLLSSISALPVMMLVIVAVLGVITGKVGMTVAGLGVNVAPLGIVLLVAAAFDWPMGLPSLMIGAIALGVAVDDTVHMAMTWQASGCWQEVLRQNFRACAGSSIIAACCLALFGLSPFVPTSQFGIMLSLAILAALACDVLLFTIACTHASAP